MDSHSSLISNALLFSFKDSQNLFILVKVILHVGLAVFNNSGTFDPNSPTDQEKSLKQITPEIFDSLTNWLNIARSIATLKGFFFSFSKNLGSILEACEPNDLTVINLQSSSLISFIDSIKNDLSEQIQSLAALNEQSQAFLSKDVLKRLANLLRTKETEREMKIIEESQEKIESLYIEFQEFIKVNSGKKSELVAKRSQLECEAALIEDRLLFETHNAVDLQKQIEHLDDLTKKTQNDMQSLLVEENRLREQETTNIIQKLDRLLKNYEETVRRKTQEWEEYINRFQKIYDNLYEIYLKLPNEIRHAEYSYENVWIFFCQQRIQTSRTVSKTNYEKIRVKNEMEQCSSAKRDAFRSRDDFFYRLKSNYDENHRYLNEQFQRNSDSNSKAFNSTCNKLNEKATSFERKKSSLLVEKQKADHIVANLIVEKTKILGEINLFKEDEKDLDKKYEVQSEKYNKNTKEIELQIEKSKKVIHETITKTGHFVDVIALRFIEQVALFYQVASELSMALSSFKTFCEEFRQFLIYERDYLNGLLEKNFELDKLVKFGFFISWCEQVFPNNLEFQKAMILKYDNFKRIMTFIESNENNRVEKELNLSSIQRISLKNRLKALAETEACQFKKREVISFSRKLLELTAFQGD